MEVVRMWAGHLVRRGWRATVFLALLAGRAGGIAMAAWSAGRRTATAFDRFLEYADSAELLVTFCPPGLVVIDEAACHATALAVGAAAAGVPLGVVLGRLGWQAVADQIGVAGGPVTPLVGITLTVFGAVVVANVIAAYPAWRAARVPTAELLRVE